jgi:hypothetical protein
MTTRSPLIDLDDPGSFGELLQHVERSAPAVPPVPVAVRGLSGDTGQVLRGIRALLAFCAFALVGILMCVVALVNEARQTPSGFIRASTVQSVQLSIPGPDPAADYYAHVSFTDGTERDITVGAFLLDGVLSIEFAVQAAPEQSTSCRIVIDGVRVADQYAEAERTATCRWSAP